MRWLRSFLLSWLMVAGGVDFLTGGNGNSASSVQHASHGGSELPWFTPILVSLTLLSVAYVYWRRHRPRPPADEEGPPVSPDLAEAADPVKNARDPEPAPPKEPPPARLRGLLRPATVS